MTVPLPEPPVFDATSLPGGLWRTYESRHTVDAVFVRGVFVIRYSSGELITHSDSYVFVDSNTGSITALDAATFAALYR